MANPPLWAIRDILDYPPKPAVSVLHPFFHNLMAQPARIFFSLSCVGIDELAYFLPIASQVEKFHSGRSNLYSFPVHGRNCYLVRSRESEFIGRVRPPFWELFEDRHSI
jgi:hypothetical protein